MFQRPTDCLLSNIGIKRPNRTNLVFDFKGMRWGDYKVGMNTSV